MGIQVLFEVFKDRRSAGEKMRDRFCLALALVILLTVVIAGIYEIFHLIYLAL